MGRSAKIREQLIASFRAELAEHLQTMTDGLLSIEQGRLTDDQRRPMLEAIFRAAHSLKGAARAVNLTVIEQLAHSLETVLEAMQRELIPLTPDLYTVCYRALDAIQAVQSSYEAGEVTPPLEALIVLADLEAFRNRPRGTPPGPPPRPAGAAPPAALVSPPAGEETIRIGVGKLDTLMAQLGELLVARIRAEQRLAQLGELQEALARCSKEWQPADGTALHTLGVDAQRWQELTGLAADLARQQAGDLTHLSHVVDALHEEIKRIRMLPLHTLTAPFGRMVRDLARDAGKEAVLEVVGGETELDKRVLEQIKDPLIHLLRNAIDHGVETPERRIELGKPPAGFIRLTANQAGQDVLITVADDGAGLDLDAIRHTLVRQGRDGAQTLTPAELEETIFNTGVTTSPIITGLSGRGIGLTIVRRNIEALRGRVTLDWVPGAGCTFNLTLPLTLASARGLLVRAAGQPFVIPLSAVERLLSVEPENVRPVEGYDTIWYNDRPLALVRLDRVLGLPPAPSPAAHRSPAVVLAAGERRLAFVVDELLGEQEVVIKGLGPQLQRVAGIGGATVMGTGEVMLILDAQDLIRLALHSGQPSIFEQAGDEQPDASPAARLRILIVDDSITTRTLEKNILEAVGFDVQVATDGQEALAAIATGGVPDLVISDILMPHMNGFELTRRLRGEERTAAVPVILVSSLDSAEDKARGIEVGADAYVVKSGFDQQNLLDLIQQLI